jgi:hypothetical protein
MQRGWRQKHEKQLPHFILSSQHCSFSSVFGSLTAGRADDTNAKAKK